MEAQPKAGAHLCITTMCRESGWKAWLSEGDPGILQVPNTLKYCCMSRGFPPCKTAPWIFGQYTFIHLAINRDALLINSDLVIESACYCTRGKSKRKKKMTVAVKSQVHLICCCVSENSWFGQTMPGLLQTITGSL